VMVGTNTAYRKDEERKTVDNCQGSACDRNTMSACCVIIEQWSYALRQQLEIQSLEKEDVHRLVVINCSGFYREGGDTNV
jgi:hypothetical protein